jgi:hypothetical protein
MCATAKKSENQECPCDRKTFPVPSYEKKFDKDPEMPSIVTETLRLVPVPGMMVERTEESLDIEVPDNTLRPMAASAFRFVKPNPFPSNTTVPGDKQGAFDDDRDERNRRS